MSTIARYSLICIRDYCLRPQAGLFVPLALGYGALQRRYSRCLRPLSALEAKKLEPVLAAARDALEGRLTLRAFGRADMLLKAQLAPALRTSASYSATVISAQFWLAFRCNVIIYGTLVSVPSIAMAAAISPSQDSTAPAILSNIFQLSGVVGAAALLMAALENSLLAVARLTELARLPDEEAVSNNDDG